MWAELKSGTRRASDLTYAMRWRGQRKQGTPAPGFGVVPWCQLTDKASSCSGRRWVTLTTWPDTSNPLCKSTAFFWIGSHASRICRVLGFSCCIVHQLGPTTCFVQWIPTGLVNSQELWNCACDILQIEAAQTDTVRSIVSLPLVLGGLGFRSAERVRSSAYWASRADCIPTIDARHPAVAESLVRELEGHPHSPCLRAAQEAAWDLEGVLGWSPPSWFAVRNGARPDTHQPEEFEPGGKRGWQHEAASRVDQRFRDEDLFVRLTNSGQALVRSQGGRGAGLALATCPTCRIRRIEPQLFRIVLLRRLNLPLPLSARFCRCGLPLDLRGHHRAACSRAGILGRRAGGRVTTNVMVRDLDLAEPHIADTRRLEVVADGLPLFGEAQLAIDTTIVSTLHANGEARSAHVDGAALSAARRRKERTYPKLIGRPGRARLVVLGVEVCGRWSVETQSFFELRSLRPLLRKRAEQAWRLRWGSLISCTVARAVAMSLLGLPGVRGADGQCPPFHDVERDFRHVGLDPQVFSDGQF